MTRVVQRKQKQKQQKQREQQQKNEQKEQRYPMPCIIGMILLTSTLVLCGTVHAGEKMQLRGFHLTMDKELYYYDRYGKKMINQFVRIVDRDGEYTYYFGEDGQAVRGLREIGDRCFYYFDEDALMISSEVKAIEEKTWYFGEDGKADWVLERFP